MSDPAKRRIWMVVITIAGIAAGAIAIDWWRHLGP